MMKIISRSNIPVSVYRTRKGTVERASWDNKIEFFLSCVGYAVGLGNVWRFPYLCYRNGGGAFLIPYVICLILVGLPIFFMELSFGQFASLGPFTIWRVSPFFKGVGFGSIIISAMTAIYYNVVIAYALFYLLVSLVSFDGGVPWATCGNPWNTDACRTEAIKITDDMNETLKVNLTLQEMNVTCVYEAAAAIGQNFSDLNTTFLANFTDCNLNRQYKTPSDEYFSNYVLRLDLSEGIWDLGGFSPKLVLVLLLAWILCFFSLKNGVKSSGKVIYFTALFPYLVLIILLVRGLTLDGYYQGIEFYVIPKWEKLLDPRVWSDAASQIFYSLGPAFGSLITMASYNPFNNNCYRDAILVAIINCTTSIFAGFVIFAVLGFMAEVTNQPVEKVAADGPGLIFVAYPEGIARMPFPPVWAFFFFLMILSLGLSSQFAMVEAIVSAIADEFPKVLRPHKGKLTFAVCLGLFALGLPLVTYGGIYVLTLMNDYSGSYALLFTCLVEFIALSWVYGWNKFSADIEMMLGFKPNYYWKGTWMVISPLVIVLILIATAVKFSPSRYGTMVFEDYAQNWGWGMVSLPVAAIVITMVIQSIRYGGIRNACKSEPNWGPARPEDRHGRYAVDNVESGEKNKGFESDDPPPYVNGTAQSDQYLAEKL
ncbi:hypothetical protein FSP39_021741 [Pinctada imbricata]|uniref:Transporter n=1 Tax=Pinctada imbricata TaxID=66713 RepID=A0AA88Y8G0_PINIB|nr:hypothetical protein FSP39_021741 [Pinctada imbricata]